MFTNKYVVMTTLSKLLITSTNITNISISFRVINPNSLTNGCIFLFASV